MEYTVYTALTICGPTNQCVEFGDFDSTLTVVEETQVVHTKEVAILIRLDDMYSQIFIFTPQIMRCFSAFVIRF